MFEPINNKKNKPISRKDIFFINLKDRLNEINNI